MRKITLLAVVFLIAIVAVEAQLLRPKVKETSIWEKIKEYFQPKQKLDIQTSCYNVNFTEYDGVTRSGYLNVGIKNSNSALSFIFYGALGVAEDQLRYRPTIIWLNGGPGCSSQFGNFFELGPLYVNQTSSGDFYFTRNNFTWANEYNVIFVDQPIGTGISYAEATQEIPTNQDQIAAQFTYALDQLYNTQNGCFSQLGIKAEDSPLFIFGESYAGKYVPSIGAKIVQDGNKFNLKGVGIGDGFTVPYYVVGALSDYAYANHLTNQQQHLKGLQVAQQSQKAINNSQWQIATSYFNQDLSVNNPEDVDVYNIHRSDEPDSSALDNLFNSKFGQQLFNLKLAKKYAQCDNTVYSRLGTDFMQGDCIHRVEYLLAQNIHVTVFNGNLDLIVPYTATESWLQILNWTHINDFNSAQPQQWTQDGNVYGTVKSFKNLEYRLVYNSGHMVPQDQPAAAFDLITNSVNNALNNAAAF